MRLLIGVSGGIAAYKALETARLAIKAGHSVRVIQTPTSQRFVGAASFAAITGAPVLSSEFEPDPTRGAYPGEPLGGGDSYTPISHLALVERADVFLIAPASANTIAKLAAGMADNLVTTAALAAACPVLVAPAMNNRMYLNAATRDNIVALGARGITVLEPGTGELASRGEYGVGRLPEPSELLAAVEAVALAPPEPSAPATRPTHTIPAPSVAGDLSGLRVLVSAGGTQEPIDSVRFIGNHSSGRMGYALAQQARARGASVILLAANVTLEDPDGVELVRVRTAAELKSAAEQRFAAADILLMAAAVADFRPAHPAGHKLKKTGSQAPSAIALEPTSDIISALAAAKRSDQTIVGFAAEHGEGAVAYGRDKLARKGLDAVVVNDISRSDIGFDATDNEVTIVTAGGDQRVAKATKQNVADAILDVVTRLRAPAARGRDGAWVGASRH